MSKLSPKARTAIAVVLAAIAVAAALTAVLIAVTGDPRSPTATTAAPEQLPKKMPPGPPALPLVPSAEDAHVEPGQPSAPAAAEGEIPGKTEAEENAIRAANAETIDEQTYDTSGVLRGATAEPARIRCLTTMHGAARPLSAIGIGVVHVTVSANVPGVRDVNGLCDFFRRVQASPTWTVDNEGNSAENVPLGFAPWTQAFYNRVACSIENVGSTGRPGEGPAEWTDVQYREGARLMARCFKLAGIPVRRGAVVETGPSSGQIIKTGVVTHEELGRPGGGHSDPGPKFDMARFMELMRRAAGSVTAIDRVTCRKIRWWRAADRPQGEPQRNASRRVAALKARGVVCRSSGPVRV